MLLVRREQNISKCLLQLIGISFVTRPALKRVCGSRKDVMRPEDFTVHHRDIEQKQLKGCNTGEDTMWMVLRHTPQISSNTLVHMS